MPNTWNLPASNIFNNNFNAKTPVINDVTIATAIIELLNNLPDSISKKPKILAPKITGIESINENLAASFGGIPKDIPIVMVVPDLEIPGMIAIACVIPINIEEDNEKFFFQFLKFLEKTNKIPVIHKATPTVYTLSKISFI